MGSLYQSLLIAGECVIFRKTEGLRTLLEGQCLQLLMTNDRKTAVHVALERQKTERALILLEMSGGKT